MVVTLYERLGGYNAIATVVDSLIQRLISDPRLSKYFVGHCEASKRCLRQLQVDMVCEATGGPCFYTGRDMKTVHEGLGIDEADWAAAIKHTIEVMDLYNVPDSEQKEVLGMLSSLKSDIVEKS